MKIKNMNQREYVTLVDPLDKVIGTHEKLSAHKAVLLQRAFSIFIFNSKDQLLIQRRAQENIIQVVFGRTRAVAILAARNP